MDKIFNRVAHKVIRPRTKEFATYMYKPIVLEAAKKLGGANFVEINVEDTVFTVKDIVIFASASATYIELPDAVRNYQISSNFKVALDQLRNIRHRHPAAVTARLLVHDVIRTELIGRTKCIIRKIRALFAKTNIIFLTSSWRTSVIIEKIQKNITVRHTTWKVIKTQLIKYRIYCELTCREFLYIGRLSCSFLFCTCNIN